MTKEINIKKKGQRKKWTAGEKKLVMAYFKGHIKKKKAPTKQETEEFLKKYKKEFANINWVLVKTFVYNCYK